jgi:hypothetical protein
MPSARSWAKTHPALPRNDDRIVRLGLHHHVTSGIGHNVIIDAWWASQRPAPVLAGPNWRRVASASIACGR